MRRGGFFIPRLYPHQLDPIPKDMQNYEVEASKRAKTRLDSVAFLMRSGSPKMLSHYSFVCLDASRPQ